MNELWLVVYEHTLDVDLAEDSSSYTVIGAYDKELLTEQFILEMLRMVDIKTNKRPRIGENDEYNYTTIAEEYDDLAEVHYREIRNLRIMRVNVNECE